MSDLCPNLSFDPTPAWRAEPRLMPWIGGAVFAALMAGLFFVMAAMLAELLQGAAV